MYTNRPKSARNTFVSRYLLVYGEHLFFVKYNEIQNMTNNTSKNYIKLILQGVDRVAEW